MAKSSAKQKYIHPFPARMAPEIAINAISNLNAGDIILDPMVGSGTVLHQAALNGVIPIGFDLDPLAVLMSRVRTNKINIKKLYSFYELISKEAKQIKLKEIYLPWIDEDIETHNFIKYWFARKQTNDLRKIAFVVNNYKVKHKNCIEIDALRIALSRIIITKKIGASLAWDISHSRPHKVRDVNDYDVFKGFKDSAEKIGKYLQEQQCINIKSQISLGDARCLKKIQSKYVDKVITSPPYLNAIDYMRGHKFSLVWLGYSIPKLREIRAVSIGAEKKIEHNIDQTVIDRIYNQILKGADLQNKHCSMIRRYIHDSILLMAEISRVLKKDKEAVLVVGDSNLSGFNIRNSEIFNQAGKLVGLNLNHTVEREIPVTMRYLPISLHGSNSLNKRMKHEVIMTFTNSGR